MFICEILGEYFNENLRKSLFIFILYELTLFLIKQNIRVVVRTNDNLPVKYKYEAHILNQIVDLKPSV